MAVKLFVEERSVIGDGSQFKREFSVRASVEDAEAGQADALIEEIRLAAQKQMSEWEDAAREAHYRMSRRSMIAQMLNSVVEGETTGTDLLDVIMETTGEVLTAEEMELVKREVGFALRLAKLKNQSNEGDDSNEGSQVVTGVRIERMDQGYGRRRKN